jgi:hypothetical protein
MDLLSKKYNEEILSNNLSVSQIHDLSKKYILISTEFKYTNKRLGLLNSLSYKMTELLDNIDINIFKIINTISREEVNKKITYVQNQRTKKNEIFNNSLKIIIHNLIKLNIYNLYKNKIIVDEEFIAIILNHHIVLEPYLHIVYTTLKYDFSNNKIYFDIFISCTQFITLSLSKQSYFFPVMNDEYSKIIYKIVYIDINDIYLLYDRLQLFVKYREKSIIINYDLLKLKINKNIVEHLQQFTPTDDFIIKQNLCIVKPNSTLLADFDKIYSFLFNKIWNIIKKRDLIKDKNYIIVATTYSLLQTDTIFYNDGHDNHAEHSLIDHYKDDEEMMKKFRTTDVVLIIRYYKNGNVGCGVPCQQCVNFLKENKIRNVIYSVNKTHYILLPINKNTITYTTDGNKLFKINNYLYDDYTVKKRPIYTKKYDLEQLIYV